MIDQPAPTDRSQRLRDCVWIVAIFALPLVILRPLQDAAFVDDWCFHWSVEHFLQTGRLEILEYSAPVHPVQTLWGSLFCLASGGFSFAADRFSIWVLGASTLCAVYLLARELGAARRQALLGAAMLGACPLFFVLSLSFMTDVPLVATSTWAAYALVCALRKRSDRWLLLAVAMGSLAAGIRLTAGVFPVAMLLVLLFHAGRWGRNPLRLAAAFLPLICLAAFMIWHRSHTAISADLSEVDNAPARHLELFKHYALPLLPKMTANSVVFFVAMCGAALMPLAIGTIELSRKSLIQIAIIVACLLVTGIALRYRGQTAYRPLTSGAIWRLEELGASTDLSPGGAPAKPYPASMVDALYCIFLASGAALVTRAFSRPPVVGEQVLRWLVIGHVMLAALLWLFYDRYALPVLPLLVVMALAGSPVRFPITVAGVAFFAILSLVGMRDHLAYNRELWQSVRDLHREGISISEINAGYVVNGWFQYAHPEDAPRDASGKIFVPRLTSDDELPYAVSNRPLEGYQVMSQREVHRWLGPDVTVYSLQRRGAETSIKRD